MCCGCPWPASTASDPKENRNIQCIPGKREYMGNPSCHNVTCHNHVILYSCCFVFMKNHPASGSSHTPLGSILCGSTAPRPAFPGSKGWGTRLRQEGQLREHTLLAYTLGLRRQGDPVDWETRRDAAQWCFGGLDGTEEASSSLRHSMRKAAESLEVL